MQYSTKGWNNSKQFQKNYINQTFFLIEKGLKLTVKEKLFLNMVQVLEGVQSITLISYGVEEAASNIAQMEMMTEELCQ